MRSTDRDSVSAIPASTAVAVALLAAVGLGGCNDHPLLHLQRSVAIVRDVPHAAVERTKLDLLWVIDNSGSMCQEQANLTRNFEVLAGELADRNVDIQIGVVTTDVRDPAQAGRLQNVPATEHNLSCDQPCGSDDACGGGCLCGVPHIRRCEDDAACLAGERCVAAPGGTGGIGAAVRHCAAACDPIGVDLCGAQVRASQVLTCQRHELAPTGGLCMLTPCGVDADCAGGERQRCMPAEDGGSYCRKVAPTGEAQCPPPTCDCPQELPTFVSSLSDPQTLEREFRCIASVGTQGDRDEKGLEAMRKALSPQMTGPGGPNAGFLRDDAHLAVAFLTDEDDCSDAVQTCDDPGAACQICPAGGVPCRGLTQDDRMICEDDPTDGVSWCRIPSPESGRCHELQDFLVPISDYAEHLQSLKPAGLRVIVAGIVGPPPNADGATSGGPGPDAGDPTCASPTGLALSGGRYIDLIDRFGELSTWSSICAEDTEDGEFTEALQRIADVFDVALGAPICLDRPLRTCTADADCAGTARCLQPQELSRSYCADPATGAPTDLFIEVQDAQGDPRPFEARFHPSEARFHPSAPSPDHPGIYGCFVFTAGAPGFGETARIRHRADLIPDP